MILWNAHLSGKIDRACPAPNAIISLIRSQPSTLHYLSVQPHGIQGGIVTATHQGHIMDVNLHDLMTIRSKDGQQQSALMSAGCLASDNNT